VFPTSGRLWFASRNFFSLSNQLCERGILILFCHLELLLMGVLRANCCSWCCDCRGCRDLWIHAWGEFRTCFLSLLLDQLLLYLCEYNIKWRFLIVELVRIFPLPIKLFGSSQKRTASSHYHDGTICWYQQFWSFWRRYLFLKIRSIQSLSHPWRLIQRST